MDNKVLSGDSHIDLRFMPEKIMNSIKAVDGIHEVERRKIRTRVEKGKSQIGEQTDRSVN